MTTSQGDQEEPLTYAQQQLRAARHDPRLDRGRGAVVADFAEYLDEADRSRSMYIVGVHDTLASAPDAQARSESPDGASQRALKERTELAAADIDNGHAHLNAMTLVGLVGALDALVEELVPSYNAMRIDAHVQAAIDAVKADHEDMINQLPLEASEQIKSALVRVLLKGLPRARPPRGHGSERWEEALRQAGLGIPASHPIPQDLEEALTELTSLRNVFVHRAGRLDGKAIAASPTLVTQRGFAMDALVRLGQEDYRRYSAALRAYAADVEARLLAPLGVLQPVEWSRWQEHYYVGA